MVATYTRLLSIALMCLVFVATAAGEEGEIAPDYAEAVNGLPAWEERLMHQWINRARVQPSVDLAGCGSNCSPAEMASTCYTPMPPLMWRQEIGLASKFHADSMARMNFFGHNTPCALRQDLSSVYPASCDGSSACSCSGSGSASPQTRGSRFGGSISGEIVAAGYSDPSQAFYGWLHEPVASSTSCQYFSGGMGNTNGHRWLILKAGGSLGSGFAAGGSWGRYYVADFGGSTTGSRVPSGSHYPRQASTVAFWANWYDGAPPSSAAVVVDGVSHGLTLGRGSGTNGAWTANVSGLATGCHRYYFRFLDSTGTEVRHPTTGTLAVGDGVSCPDFLAGAAVSGDFDGDGQQDVLWRNQNTGLIVIWFMDGHVVRGSADVGVVPLDWKIAGAADFDGDGKSDILWRHSGSGAVNIWLMDGARPNSGHDLPSASLSYRIAGVGNFAGDSTPDILWHNPTTGLAVVWTLAGTSVVGGHNLGVASTAYAIEGVGDFDGNSTADILWRHNGNGYLVLWSMNGLAVSGSADVGYASSAYEVGAVGDYNRDGRSDILWWSPATGGTVAWFMQGSSIIGSANLPGASSAYRMAGPGAPE